MVISEKKFQSVAVLSLSFVMIQLSLLSIAVLLNMAGCGHAAKQKKSL